MNDILLDLSMASLITAIEENLFSFIPAFGKWPRAEVHEEDAIKWSMTDIPFPIFNSIMRAQLPPENIDATLQSLITRAKSRNIPLLWWTGPSTQPMDLGECLLRHGFINGGQSLGMAVDLANLNQNLPTPDGFTAQRVNDTATLKQWCYTWVAGFGIPDFVAEAFYDFMSQLDSDTILAYLGWLNGTPVATSLLMLAAGVAGIYSVATIPETRRQGIGALLTALPLRDARARGYKAGILHATEMGAGIYRSLGFQEYCQIGQYVWSSA